MRIVDSFGGRLVHVPGGLFYLIGNIIYVTGDNREFETFLT